MRILWHSVAPWCPSGYGQQTALFAPRIRDQGHEVTISSWWGLNGAAMEYDGINVLPADQKFGNIILPSYAERQKAEAVIALMDAWVLIPQVMRDLPLAVWAPVDHKPCPPRVAEFFKLTGATPIAMSRFGEQCFREEGLNPLYVPHGVDTNIFKPDSREAARAATGTSDNFIVGIVAHNSGGRAPSSGPSRKAFPQSLMAFAVFQRRHPDAVLYLHTELTGRPGLENGLNIPRLLDRFEIPVESVKFSDQLTMETGFEPQQMAHLYAAFDVLLNPSYGEGFGVPIIEAQACGTPVIVSDWTSMPELCGAGWKVGGEPWYDAEHESFFLNPSVEEILNSLESAYEAREDETIRKRARKFALEYDADLIAETYWKPVLETLSRPREVSPLNRAMRRAKEKATA